MASVAIILGSVRPGRAGDQVVRWIEDQARQVEGVQTVFFDLRDKFGQTFVIVTHDEELAKLTDRTIHLRDGMVERDLATEQPSETAEQNEEVAL